jgi:hypothetical protein
MAEVSGDAVPALSSMADHIGIGVLTRLVPRELVDEVVVGLGRKEQRSKKLPARVTVYFVLALALFYGDGNAVRSLRACHQRSCCRCRTSR